MATNLPARAKPEPPDPEAIRSTLKWIWDRRRLNQFILRGIRQKRKALDIQEARVRKEISMFTQRLDRELDRYPKESREAGFVRHIVWDTDTED